MRYLPDGSILFSRAEPKVAPAGYVSSPDNPCHYIPEPGECKHREMRRVIMPCGKLKIIYHCRHFNKEVVMAYCNQCDDSEEP